MTSQLNIGVVALTYCLTAMAVISLGFKIFKTPYEFWELRQRFSLDEIAALQ
jgi:hypothetical protein